METSVLDDVLIGLFILFVGVCVVSGLEGIERIATWLSRRNW